MVEHPDNLVEHPDNLRAADSDRERVATRLREAVDEGRLTLHEYDDRLRAAYAAKTYGELGVLVADLPAPAPPGRSRVVPAPFGPSAPAPAFGAPGAAAPARMRGEVPSWLLGVWGVWLTAVTINVVIWVLVSLSAGELVYFWPMWVAGPWGAVLLATTFSGLFSGAPSRWAHKQRWAEQRRLTEKQRRAEKREHRRNPY
ncbi:MAG TPA: DUF1707 domain-containing protein [Micromonosporaceae bacterium]|nr:DUF1707 domain-containing protein [Micromonosporaceae bacterium]